MSDAQISLHASVPSIDSILRLDTAAVLVEQYGRSLVTEGVRQVIADIRSQITELGEKALPLLAESAVVAQVARYVEDASAPSLRAVYNLTGTVLHTNLGRAVMAKEAIDAMVKVATGASNLEYDIESGKRGDRDSHLDDLLCKLTGAEAATVVNNNAAAVLLVLNTLGQRKEVPVSRGELIEIGGAFRIPDIMKRAGCKLVEIGTTNRTHLKDYEGAINSNTALLMKVHTSNYEIRGFTNSVSEEDLSQLAQEKALCFVSDLGSGTLVDLSQFGLPHEPTVTETLEYGADIVTFSGDKLLGGPQAGIIVGKKDLIQKIKSNPLKRALRVDKITLAALTEIVSLYRDPRRLTQRIPLLRDLARPITEINSLAERLLPVFRNSLAVRAEVSIEDCKSQIGSGALPLDLLASKGIVITPTAKKGQTDAALQRLAKDFRDLPIPVIGRINDGKLIFDLRCLEDETQLCAQMSELPA